MFVPALSEVNFDVYKGETLGVVGKNGSGKSTLLRALAGIYKPDQGLVRSDAMLVLAPLLLALCRFGQGFGLGGEWGGAVLLATENAPPGKRSWYGMFPQLGAPLGFIIANSVFLAISWALPHPDGPTQQSEAFLAWGWRVPFLFSAVMVIIGLWVRLRLVESETFVKAGAHGALRKFPLVTVVRRNGWQIVLGTFIMLATYVLFYLMTNFTLSYGTKAADLDTATAAARTAAEASGQSFDAAAFAQKQEAAFAKLQSAAGGSHARCVHARMRGGRLASRTCM